MSYPNDKYETKDDEVTDKVYTWVTIAIAVGVLGFFLAIRLWNAIGGWTY